MFLVIGGLSMLAHFYTLNGIKSKTVGDGQHGVARFLTKKEIKKTYLQVPYDVKHWREGRNLPTEQGLVVGSLSGNEAVTGLVDTGDVHCLMIGAAGVGKTAFFLYPNLEYACASGMSFITTDTKGDLARNYGAIAKDNYGYNIAVIDLRNPTKSDGNNLLHLVNKYMDMYRADKENLMAKAKAEKYAKIIAKTIICSDGDNSSMGQNAFFYDSAEGLLSAVILLLAEFLPTTEIDGQMVDKRHIVSVFKMVQDLTEPSKVKGKSQFQVLMEMLPSTHKAKWFAGAALNSSEAAMASVLSTVLSRLNAFLDTEMEQILCFHTAIDAETFCKEKSAIFLILPEEDNTKYFMVSLFLQQFYREMLAVADENSGKLPNRVVIYADEIGTIPKIDSFEMMLSAGRSRRISVVPIIQSFAQLDKNYGKEGSEIITDNCQLTIFGGFAPNSETAETLSKALGARTVLSGSISRGKNDPSQSLQMMERPLLTADELKSLKKGNFVVMKTGTHPMQTRLKLFLDWGITFDKIYETEERSHRKVYYADKDELAENILNGYGNKKSADKTPPQEELESYGGMKHAPGPSQELTEQQPKTKLRP
ncbi:MULTISPECIES: VirD4-like conjugal transfer protein, CD1115 family [Lactonifactor]|uniref:VirD4-like conjugal transfer protein, CD1115 family n=1 Tax=Lactonifactor TaxID=420345 RepID=UPI001D0248C8|nr:MULTISPECIES: type IV secretory system conjugative DNA transfer family protein [Lactonifactor]MCB5713560.1 type IV secretory system conjugative DNA transfer family protein [Lactonifactor longoviformis]MCB5717659.1 type IV secretory system conjugative DNA transfer family protein [Lactonifactor longoviformis]